MRESNMSVQSEFGLSKQDFEQKKDTEVKSQVDPALAKLVRRIVQKELDKRNQISPPWSAFGTDSCPEGFELKTMKSSFDLIYSDSVTPVITGMCLIMYAIEITVLIYAIVMATQNNIAYYNLSTIAVGGLYATISIMAAAYQTCIKVVCFLFEFASFLDNESKSSVSFSFRTLIFFLAETTVILLSTVALLMLLPQQGDVVNIVLNCVSIITISQLDEQIFGVFNFQIIVPSEAKELEEIHQGYLTRVILPLAGAGAFYIGDLVIAHWWNLLCDRNVNCN